MPDFADFQMRDRPYLNTASSAFSTPVTQTSPLLTMWDFDALAFPSGELIQRQIDDGTVCYAASLPNIGIVVI